MSTSHMKAGIIAAPGQAEKITGSLIDFLSEKLNTEINDDLHWEIEWLVDPLTGAAETAEEILDNANVIKQRREWDYAICLTDLPIFHTGNIVAADISFHFQVAQISVPTYGMPPVKNQVEKSIIHLFKALYEENSVYGQSIKQRRKTEPLHSPFPMSFVQREEAQNNKNDIDTDAQNRHIEDKNQPNNRDNEQADNEPNERYIDVRFLVTPKIIGLLRLIIGMTFSNNPLKIMSAFKGVLAIAFATGAFALVFPTVWKLSHYFSAFRLTIIMLVAILGLAFWIILIYNLWESPSSKNNTVIRRLYNGATVSTLVIDVAGYYFLLFLLFFTVSAIFIPPDYLAANLSGNEQSALFNYMRVAWAEASIATIVSTMGAGLEEENTVRNLTYGFRQKQRYNEMKNHQNS